MAKVFKLRMLRPAGGLRFEVEFRCANTYDEHRLDRLVRRLAKHNRIQVCWGAFCVDAGPGIGNARMAKRHSEPTNPALR
jgi:hypothetical protein